MNEVDANELDLVGYDEIIDVRAPIEFAEDHVPGAINLPVLTDDERATVGTIYKQESVFEARKIGAGLVSANIAKHLRTHFSDKPGGYRPLVYCWRGGQRSRSMATVMAEVGWPLTLLKGGYKAFRKRVLSDLDTAPRRFRYRVLAGLTGTGKTEVLHRLRERGEQILDLEGLANHQGSLLGEPGGGQGVTQKKFDTRIWNALRLMDSSRPVWTEAESSKIGRVFCPKALLTMLRCSERIEIEVSIDDRVRYLNERYAHWHMNPAGLIDKLKWLNQRHGQAEIDAWTRLIESGEWASFVRRLLETHYDPAYRTALGSTAGPVHRVSAASIADGGCHEAASALLALPL